MCMAFIVLTVSLAPASLANEQAHANLELEHITVTARKRVESSIDVPIAITTLSGAQLTSRGLSNLEQISEFVPGLELGRTNTGSAARLYIRGVGQRDPRNFVDPAVGLYLDGVYAARADGALLDLVDIESVEVLRGPQGALFGKNTVGGAIKLATRQPSNELERELRIRAGNLQRADVLFRVSGTLGPNLFGSAALSSVNRDGYLTHPFNGMDFNDEQRQGLRTQLLWEPDADFSVRTIVDVGRQRERGAGSHCVLAAPSSGTLGASPVGSALEIDSACRRASSAALSVDNTLINGGRYDLDSRSLTVLTNKQFTSWTLSSVSAIRHQRLAIESDQDGSDSNVIGLFTHRPDRRTQWSQELTASGLASNERLHWTSGIYLFDERNAGEQLDAVIGPAGVVSLTNSGPSSVFVLGTSRDTIETSVRSYAAYSHIELSFSEHWKLSAGLRYTWERRNLFALQATLDPDLVTANAGAVGASPGRPRTPNGGIVVLPQGSVLDTTSIRFGARISACNDIAVPCEEQSIWRRASPSLALSNTTLGELAGLHEGLMYLSVSQGFKSGAINLLSNTLSVADPEILNNVEVGFKLRSADQRLEANGAFFFSDYSSIQVPIAVPPVTQTGDAALPAGIADTGLVNAAKATIKGGELELRYTTNWGLSGNLSASYLDARYDEFNDRFGAGDRSEESFSGIPQWQLQMGFQWIIPSSEWGLFTPRIDYSWQDRVSHHFGFSSFQCACFVQPAFSKVNARLTWQPPGTRASMTAYVDNLADERNFYGASPLVDVIGGGPVFFDAPRTYGLELVYRW